MDEKPLFVTICRSIRDGYTLQTRWKQVKEKERERNDSFSFSYYYFSKIEDGVLEILNEVFGDLKLVYDGNLLGGPEGWERHARPLK